MADALRGKYLFCVARQTQPLLASLSGSGSREGAEPVYAIQEGDLAAVVRDAESDAYHLTRATAMAHQLVIQEAMRWATVLPFSFGTVANGEEEVRALLARYRNEFGDQLAYLDGKGEYGLKALWRDKDQPFREILAERPDIRRLRDAVAHRPPAEAYQDRIQVGRMVHDALEAKREAETRRVMECLDPLAVGSRVNATLMDEMLLNAAFLLAKGSEPAFEVALQAIDREYGDRVRFRLVGPSPPFNFVRMPIAWR
ncbi:MAG: GvpL/GvpF family gas vesicle protein [Chloroflexi bacterium]|nr:GvpL/GvpF family gas vesicle protein [Chloroflexota bacterium]